VTRSLRYDVLVVGSGAGGGTVAETLSRLLPGAAIAVAEKGPWYRAHDFNMRELDMMKLFREGGAVVSKNFEIGVSAAECVGGSTSVYTGVTFRAPEGLIGEWASAQALPELDEADVQARFPRIEQQIDAHFPGPELENANNRVFREGCERLGWPVKRFRVNIRGCVGCGFCNLGCAYSAKRGTLEVQIPEAMARGVELIPNCRITRVWEGGAEGVIAAPPEGTQAGRHEPGPVRFSAAKVVLAAGALSSSALLLGSGLSGLSPATGRYVTLHPAITGMARMPEPVRGFDGFPKLYYTDQFSESHHYYIETAFYFPFVTAKSLPGFGLDLKRFMRGYAHQACAIVLVHDPAEARNRIRLRGGATVLDYRLAPSSRAALVHALRRVGELFFAAGAVEYASPVCTRTTITSAAELDRTIVEAALRPGNVLVSSAHPMGGCRMGSDARTSVTDAWGRVHGHPNIVVADASLFPTSSKVNPYLTIMALAERNAEQLARDLGAPAPV
jgi:choline dehydrogenase-like flavoprotein